MTQLPPLYDLSSRAAVNIFLAGVVVSPVIRFVNEEYFVPLAAGLSFTTGILTIARSPEPLKDKTVCAAHLVAVSTLSLLSSWYL